MRYSISTFTDLPLPAKAALLIAFGASLGTVVFIIPSGARWIILIGLVVLVLLLLLYWYLLQWRKKRKAVPMERDLMKNTSAAPPVSGGDPKVVALLDDLRKKFERGIETFRANGKSLYDFPWYMVVGEPGSGKTEAVRHSNVGFPPGLQDTLQGAGGTLNMNWWFTDHAVILDTAGRMMFEQAELGGGHDWKEFLNLLKKSRRHCPINGVLLVIPADSLIRDTTDEIEQKANKIAKQFDVIQRTLNVRFPVFVVITKSDLINGFRDFFDNITDPKLQHQILGWSNPLPVDEPYRPDFIDQHVKTIKGRLFRRRLALMQQIICGESRAKEKRLADILYTFPQSLTSIAPRLARYLELIFRAGSKWSGKPLFFRGIYFTSSMREGSALDAELAETLGVPAESLPDGRVWERDRAYFLRDLLLKKVFPEQGLVTDAKDAGKQHFLRKTAILGTIAASLILFIIFTFYAGNSYENRIGKLNNYLQIFINEMEYPSKSEKIFVVQADPEDPNYYEIVKDATEENLPGELANAIENFKAKWMFIDWRSDITGRLRDAAAFIHKTSVLEPFLSATCNVMAAHTATEKDNWSYEDDPNELRALHQLIQIKANKLLNEEKKDGYSRSNFIDNLGKYIIQHGTSSNTAMIDNRNLYNQHKSKLHGPLSSKYAIFDDEWPPASIMENDPDSLDKAITNGIHLFKQFWRGPGALRDINNLKDAIKQFKDAETRMLEFVRIFDDPESQRLTGDKQLRQFPYKWKESFEKLDEARKKIDKHPANLKDSLSLNALCGKALQDVNNSYQFLLNELDPNSIQGNEFLGSLRADLDKSCENITEELEDFRRYLEPLEEKYWARIDENRLYEIRFNMYSIVNERLIADKKSDFDAIREIKQEYEKVRSALDKYAKGSPAFSLSETSELCGAVLDLDRQLRLLIVLQAPPNELNQIKEFVESISDWNWKRVKNVEPNKKFDPKGAAILMNSWKSLGEEINATFINIKKIYDNKNEIYVKYSKNYCSYWLGTLPEEWINNNIPNGTTWKDQSEELGKLDSRDVFNSLDQFGDCVAEALVAIDGNIPKKDEREKFDNNRGEITGSYRIDCKNMLDKWAELNPNVFIARDTLLEKTPRLLKSQYFPSRDACRLNSPAQFVYTYWTRLAWNSLKILADDVDMKSKQNVSILKDKNYDNMFPLKWDLNNYMELDPEGIEEAYSLLEQIPLRENYEKITREFPTIVEDSVYSDFGKLLLRLSEPTVPDRKSIERIWQVLQGLPRDQEPYYCKVSFVAASPVEYTRRFEIEQNGNKSGKGIDTSRPGEEVIKVEYGTDKSIDIKFYRYPSDNVEDPNAAEFGSYQPDLSFEGRWAVLKILFKYNDSKRDNEGFIRLPFKDKIKKEEKEEIVDVDLRLKLAFYRDEECQDPIAGFVQALLSKE